MTTWDVFREEIRDGGSTQWIGEVEADSLGDAQAEAEATFECRPTHRIYVLETDDEQQE